MRQLDSNGAVLSTNGYVIKHLITKLPYNLLEKKHTAYTQQLEHSTGKTFAIKSMYTHLVQQSGSS